MVRHKGEGMIKLNIGRFFLIIACLRSYDCAAVNIEKKNNELKQVFHHKATAQSKPQNIELGSIVFYLQADPHIEIRDQKNLQNATEYTFFMPQTKLSAQAKKMIESIKDGFNNDLYRMRIAESSQGVLVTFICKTPTVGMRYQLFESIKRDKGIVFSFYNNDLIKMLHKEKPVLTTACNGKQRIVVDCGHGGKDIGAIGPSGIQEKEVCLKIGSELADILRKEGFSVVMTRVKDKDVPLDLRTSMANALQADLFVSLHANWGPNSIANGIETYYLDTRALHMQFSSFSQHADKIISNHAAQNNMKNELFASIVHSNLINHMHKSFPEVADRKVKSNVAQVLLGTVMPSILIELGFLTSHEEKLLAMPSYQKELAQGISSGILSYTQNMKA